MSAIDRTLENRPKRRILWTALIASVLAAAMSAVLGQIAAQHILRTDLQTMLRYGDSGAFAAHGISADMLPQNLPGYVPVFLTVFAACFAVSLLAVMLTAASAMRQTDSLLCETEALAADCFRLAEDFSAEIRPAGEACSSVRRVSEGLARVAVRTQHRAAQLAAREETQRVLLSDISHQLKTALAVIRLNRDMEETVALSEEERRALDSETELQLDGMEQLVLEALKYAKIRAEAVHFKFTETDIAATCRMAAERLMPLSREKGIAVTVESEENLCVPHDRTWLCEAVENLVKNALDHADCTEVSVRLTQLPAAVRLQVCDNGRGIPLSEIPHLFTRFRSGTENGHGLGLPIAKQIFAAHGSSISVYSGDAGTEFLVFLRPQNLVQTAENDGEA